MNDNLTPKVLRSTAKIPETPVMQRIGYGTGKLTCQTRLTVWLKSAVFDLGVGVFNFQRDEQSPWAAKIISRHTGRERKHYSNRLQLEAKVLASLDHPNIIGYRAFVKRPDGREVRTHAICLLSAIRFKTNIFYFKVLLMEQCEQSLGDLIETRMDQNLGPFPVELIAKVAVDIAKALEYLHASLVLHGDIKSANILVKSKLTSKWVFISRLS